MGVLLAGCGPAYDPILICHNANCAGTGRFEDDTVDGLVESLALRYEGRPVFDGVELDTYLYFDGNGSSCLFAHDDQNPSRAALPQEATELVAAYLQQDVVSWHSERFYLKIELKPTVTGSDLFHTGPQLQQHAECVLQMASTVVANARHPVTVIFDTTAECLHNEIEFRITDPRWSVLVGNPNVDVQFSGPIVPSRVCIPVHLDIRTFFVRDWRDAELESLRPLMVWLDRHSENTETLKIMRRLRPEYIATSAAPFARSWIEGYQ